MFLNATRLLGLLLPASLLALQVPGALAAPTSGGAFFQAGRPALHASALKSRGRAARWRPDVLAQPASPATPNHSYKPDTSRKSPPTTSPTGVVYDVSPSGVDTNRCASTAPCATLLHATSLAHPGDTVNVQAGTYGPQIIHANGTASSPITVQSQGTVMLTRPSPATDAMQNTVLVRVDNSSYVTVSGFTLIGMKGRSDYNPADTTPLFGEVDVSGLTDTGVGIVLQNLNVSHSNYTCIKLQDDEQYETIQNNTLTDCGAPNNAQEHGIYLSGGFNKVLNNTINGASGFGIHSYKTSPVPVSNETIVGNSVSNATQAGIYDYQGPGLIAKNTLTRNGMGIEAWPGGLTIQQNVIALNVTEGLDLHQDTNATYTVLNNTFYRNGVEEIGTAGSGGILSVTLENNIFSGSDNRFFNGALGSGSVTDYNDYYAVQGAPKDAHSILANPAFVLPGTYFRLQLNSPCIGLGAVIAALFQTGLFNLGAY